MTIDVFSSTGTKKSTLELPAELFAARINHGLIHQAIVRQQSNRRFAIAHAKNRGEVAGSTRKLYGQKHTGRARRGPIRSPLLRGGGKAFGPRKEANFDKDMPRAMRRAALFACLSFQAKKNAIFGLESYPSAIKTKDLAALIKKLPINNRSILFVLPEKHDGLFLSARNIPNVTTVLVPYLNPEAIVNSRSIIFVGDSIAKAEAIFGNRGTRAQKRKHTSDIAQAAAEPKVGRKTPIKKKVVTKKAAAKAAAKAAGVSKEETKAPKASKKKKDSSTDQ